MKKILFVLVCFVVLVGCNNELSAPSCDEYEKLADKNNVHLTEYSSPASA